MMNGSAHYSQRDQLRARWPYFALTFGTIILGLAVHLHGAGLRPVAHDIAGDALWAMMIAWLAGSIAPRAALSRRTVAALAFCFLIEFSQLWHTPELDAIRRTTPGHLVLGSGFDARDLVAYGGGVFIAVLLERSVAPRILSGQEGG